MPVATKTGRLFDWPIVVQWMGANGFTDWPQEPPRKQRRHDAEPEYYLESTAADMPAVHRQGMYRCPLTRGLLAYDDFCLLEPGQSARWKIRDNVDNSLPGIALSGENVSRFVYNMEVLRSEQMTKTVLASSADLKALLQKDRREAMDDGALVRLLANELGAKVDASERFFLALPLRAVFPRNLRFRFTPRAGEEPIEFGPDEDGFLILPARQTSDMETVWAEKAVLVDEGPEELRPRDHRRPVQWA